MRTRDEHPHRHEEGTASVEELRARRRNLATRIQELLWELERAERDFETVNKELERVSKR